MDTVLNWLTYTVISGQGFFVGGLLIVLALGIESRLSPDRVRLREWTVILGMTLGICLIGVSSTPLPVWFYGIGTLAVFAYLVSVLLPRCHLRRPLLRAVLALVVAAGVCGELPYHLRQPIAHRQQSAIYVLGDSVSAGIGQPGVVPYPQLLQMGHGVPVTNLAVSGCTIKGATATFDQVRDPAGLVLVEIGGIDLFQNRSPKDLRTDLRNLLHRAATTRRTVVMLELPLPPFCRECGQTQRQLARQYGVILVPKRIMSGVLCTPGAADPLDRIHLTRRGQELMAERIWPWLRPNLVPHAFHVTGHQPTD